MKKTLVILDNNTVNQELYRNLSEHYSITLFESGEAFKPHLSRISADLFLIEAELPGVDGYEICRLIRSMKCFEKTPVVFCGTKVSLDDRIKCYECGGDAHVNKPFDMEALLEKLRTIMDKGATHSRRSNLEQTISNDVREQVGMEWGWDMCTSYFRQIMSCEDIDQLANYVLDNCLQLNVSTSLMFHQADMHMHFDSAEGKAITNNGKQDEYDLLVNAKNGGQLICDGQQMIFNSEHCSILVKDHTESVIGSDQLCSIMSIMTETLNQKLSHLLQQAQPIYSSSEAC